MSAVPVSVESPEKTPMVYLSAWGPVAVPTDILTLEAFRRWAKSDEYPERGWFSFLGGRLYVDLSMEQAYTHNHVKTAVAVALTPLVEPTDRGRFFGDRMLLTHPGAGLSTEPDGMYISFAAVREGRIVRHPAAEGGCIELDGTPDMVLEVVSRTSAQKDTVLLRTLYFQAGIPEYWLIDARGDQPRFDILRRGRGGYVTTRRQAGWLPSQVFGRSFRLTQRTDPLGDPQFTLEVRA